MKATVEYSARLRHRCRYSSASCFAPANSSLLGKDPSFIARIPMHVLTPDDLHRHMQLWRRLWGLVKEPLFRPIPKRACEMSGSGRRNSRSDALIDKNLCIAASKSAKTGSVSLVVISTISSIEMKRWLIWNVNEVSSYVPGTTSYKPRHGVVGNCSCGEHFIGIIAVRRSGDYPSRNVSYPPCGGIQD